jgi:DNA-directed RNA polymerase III subunit RPC3
MSQKESPILAQLCTLLVEDQYGELASSVFETLARHGRQTLSSLVRSSFLSGNMVKHGLVILIQQHLVFHNADSIHNVSSYEVDWQQAYGLVRFGKMAKMAENRFGEKAGAIVSHLASFGHVRVGDLVDAYFPPLDKQNDDDQEEQIDRRGKKLVNGTGGAKTGINGHADGANGIPKPNGVFSTSEAAANMPETRMTSPEELHAILYALLEAGWLVPVDETHYLSPAERHAEAQAWALQNIYDGNWPTGTKALQALEAKAIERKRQVRDTSIQAPKEKIRFHQPINDRKRPSEDDGNQPNKRLKGVNGTASVDTTNTTNTIGEGCVKPDFPQNVTLDADLVIRVNQDKLTVATRSEQLIRLAEQRFSRTTSIVYRALLWCLEKSEARCYEEWPDPPDPNLAKMDGEPTYEATDPRFLATCTDVAKILHPGVDLVDGLEPEVAARLLDEPPTVLKGGLLDPPVDPLALGHAERLRLINKHITCLANDRVVPFVTWESNRGGGQYRIEYDLLAKIMIQMEIDNTIMARRGKLGLRLIRALKKKGRLDEQQTCKTMLTTTNILRPVVTDMQMMGFIETQEVPKVDSRVTKQSNHLIWYDSQRVRERILHDTYKGMTRTLQRISFEKEKIQPLIDKAERSDVVGNEDKYLSKHERRALKEWQQVEEKMLIQLGRMDELVAILRDFMGPLKPEFPSSYRPNQSIDMD